MHDAVSTTACIEHVRGSPRQSQAVREAPQTTHTHTHTHHTHTHMHTPTFCRIIISARPSRPASSLSATWASLSAAASRCTSDGALASSAATSCRRRFGCRFVLIIFYIVLNVLVGREKMCRLILLASLQHATLHRPLRGTSTPKKAAPPVPAPTAAAPPGGRPRTPTCAAAQRSDPRTAHRSCSIAGVVWRLCDFICGARWYITKRAASCSKHTHMSSSPTLTHAPVLELLQPPRPQGRLVGTHGCGQPQLQPRLGLPQLILRPSVARW